MSWNWSELWDSFLGILKDNFLWSLNKLIEFLAQFIEFVSGLMPEIDFDFSVSGGVMEQVVSTINWVFPVQFFIGYLGVLSLTVVAYFTVGILLRWAKVI